MNPSIDSSLSSSTNSSMYALTDSSMHSSMHSAMNNSTHSFMDSSLYFLCILQRFFQIDSSKISSIEAYTDPSIDYLKGKAI